MALSLTVVAAATPAQARGSWGGPEYYDLNGDGYEDRTTLGSSEAGTCEARVEYGTPSSQVFSSGPTVEIATLWDDLCADTGAFIDLGGNGSLELLAINGAMGSQYMVLRDWQLVDTIELRGDPSAMDTADFNGDGLDDLWIHSDQSYGFDNYLNTPGGGLAPGNLHVVTGSLTRLVRDVTRDGAADLFIVEGETPDSGGQLVFLNGLTGARQTVGAVGPYPRLAVNDFTVDGWPDLLVVDGEGTRSFTNEQGAWFRVTPTISAPFTTGTDGFQRVSGGAWGTAGGRLTLTTPAKTTAAGNANLAVNPTPFPRGTLRAVASVTPTTNVWDDFSVAFAYRDPSNYWYASFNESNDAATNGIFRVRAGVVTQLTDFTTTIVAGTTYDIRIELGAAKVTVFRDGRVVGATDAVPQTGGWRVGVGSRDNAASWDTVEARAALPESAVTSTFAVNLDGFAKVAGGTWRATGGRLVLSAPATWSTTRAGNGNIALHAQPVTGDFVLTTTAQVTATTNAWNDVSVVYGYRDATNYSYLSVNESNNATTSGLFKVVNGVATQVGDITRSVKAGVPHVLRVERDGPTVRTYIDGTALATATDTSFVGGRVGVATANDAAWFDDVEMTSMR